MKLSETQASGGTARPAETAPPCLSPQEARSARTRRLVCDAAVRCLDEVGYRETSVLKVQSMAGVSRGALTHQYPTKEDLIVAVAEHLLEAVRHTPSPHTRPKPAGEAAYAEWLLMFSWDRFVHTREGRALSEIFIAMRTDDALAARLAGPVAAWSASIDDWFLRRLTAPGGAGEVRELVRLFRVFSRGVMLGGDVEKEDPEELVRAMARLIAPRLGRPAETGAAAPPPQDGQGAARRAPGARNG